jgi:hypothetical protein
MPLSKSKTMGGRNKNKKRTVKKTTKPSWIKFVTNHYRQHSKKNKKWTFKDSLKTAKKDWGKSKKIYKAGSGELISPTEEKVQEVSPTPVEKVEEVVPSTEENVEEVVPTPQEKPEQLGEVIPTAEETPKMIL